MIFFVLKEAYLWEKSDKKAKNWFYVIYSLISDEKRKNNRSFLGTFWNFYQGLAMVCRIEKNKVANF